MSLARQPFGADVEIKSKQTPTEPNMAKIKYRPSNMFPIVRERRQLEWNSDKQTYSAGETATIDFSLGEEFLYGPNSYLRFEIKASADNKITMGLPSRYPSESTDILDGVTAAPNNDFTRSLAGSYIRCIQDIKLRNEAGFELEYVRDIGTLTDIIDTYSCSESYLTSTGAMMGYKSRGNIVGTVFNPDASTSWAQIQLNAASQQAQYGVIIPMHHLLGLFRMDKYIPPQIGKLRLEVTLSTITRGYVLPAGGNETVSIQNLRLVGDVSRLSDAVVDAVKKMTQRETGLDIYYDTFFTDSKNYNGSSATVEIQKNVGSALTVFSRIKTTADLNDKKTDAFRSGDLKLVAGFPSTTIQYQYRVGSRFYPDRKVTTLSVAYSEMLKAVNNFSNCTRPPCVNLITYTSNSDRLTAFGADLERDNMDPDFSAGIPTNTGNNVIFELTHEDNADARTIVSFLHHAAHLVIKDNLFTLLI